MEESTTEKENQASVTGKKPAPVKSRTTRKKKEEPNANIDNLSIVDALYSHWACVTYTLDGTITKVNDHFIELFDFDNQTEILGKNISLSFDESTFDKVSFEELVAELKNGIPLKKTIKRETPLGSEVWGSSSFIPVKNQAGQVLEVFEILNDVTKEISTKNQHEAFINAVNTGWATIIYSPDGVIQEVNENFASIMGYESAEELINQHHSIFFDEDTVSEESYSQFWVDLSEGSVQSGEFRYKNKEGSDVWLNGSYTPVKDSEDKIIKVIMIATDISNVKLPVLKVSSVLQSIAEGDLTQSIELNAEGYVQEMSVAVNTAIDNLNELLLSIDELANLVAASAEEMTTKSDEMKGSTNEMTSAIQQMAEGAQDQSQQVDEISKLLSDMLTTANEVAGQADQINLAAKEGTQSAQAGTQTIKDVVDSMVEIKESAQVTSGSINALTERSEEIARALNVITDIASQTNLLALNAAIEAARAGDAGRGFAVVAEEIRKLAEDSRSSAHDIEKVIKEVQKDIDLADKSIKQMDESVKIGNKASSQAEVVFESIDKSTSETFFKSKEISRGTGKQKESIDESVKAAEKIVVVSEETASGTEEIAMSSKELRQGMDEVSASSNDLAEVASQLLQGITRFKLKGSDND